jgi:EmrB/QacA subfamily drug resistance transporter
VSDASSVDTLRAAALPPLTLPGGRLLSRRVVIVVGVMLGIFLSAVEATVVGTALPSIVGSLHGIKLYGWVVTAYLVTSTISVPIWGRLADLHGRRPFYTLGIAVFLLGSVLSGAVPEPAKNAAPDALGSMPLLIAARALQGLGAGAVLPIGVTMVADIFSLEERARVQGWLSSVWGLSSVVGPIVGGVIAEKLSWRWVFFLNVPPGILAAFLVSISWRESREKAKGHLRIAPVLLLAGSLALMLIAVGSGKGDTKTAGLGPGAAVGALVLGALFVLVERRSDTPIFDLTLFRNKMVRAVVIGGPLVGIAMFAAITFVPLFIQGVLGRTPTQAGQILGWLFVVWVAGSALSPRLALKVGFRPLAVAGAASAIVGYVILSRAGPDSTYATIAASMLVVGAGMGLTIAPLMIGVQSSVEQRQRGQATSLCQFSRALGGTLGVAAISTILASGLSAEVARLSQERGLPAARASVLTGDLDAVLRTSTTLPEVERSILKDALASSLRMAFATALVASIAFFFTTFMIPGGTRPAPVPHLERLE